MDNVTGEEFQRPSAYGYHVPYISHANFSTSNTFLRGGNGQFNSKIQCDRQVQRKRVYLFTYFKQENGVCVNVFLKIPLATQEKIKEVMGSEQTQLRISLSLLII